ncbi:MAG: hypothetical protein HRT61_14785 [Ekhidna sp.]|nr:hypothetical protein [Ekhidna sp.]
MREAIFGLNLRKVKGRPFSFPCRSFISSLAFLCAISGYSQNLICKEIPTNTAFKLDSIPIEAKSIALDQSYTFNDSTMTIVVRSSNSKVEVCYRTISTLITEPMRNRSLSDYDNSRSDDIIINTAPSVEKEELFDFGGVNKYGAVSRGISFGNRQSLFVNSTLNLQMDGKLDENLNISAVITDQNVPYQPEGNTQQIRDFDNVFIKLYNSKFDLTAGDIVLRQPDNSGYFLRYLKNVQGLQTSYRGEKGGWRHETRVSGALSKGKFNSAIITPIDGLTGPYRLRGPNGERFIIVLANSEKVFIDGKLMERGFDRDYVIDYNLGEITFNNHIVITQFTIIRVDFEYAEQFYSRSNLSAYQTVSNDNVSFTANYYRERDNPNATFGLNLNEDDLDQLRGIGDNLDQAFVGGADSVQFSENRILYLQKDTVDNEGLTQRIFQYSTDPTQRLFSPSFSEVGFGNGDYVLLNSSINGRVYQWVSPENGVSQGNYQSGLLVPLPNSRQVATLGTSVKLSDYESVSGEVAFSNTDLNLYSDIGDSDNSSRAYFVSLKSTERPSFISNYGWVGELALEYDEENFTFIDRYRPILFDRDWNYTPVEGDGLADLMLFAQAGLRKDDANQMLFSLNHRKRGNRIDGWQQTATVNHEFSNFKIMSTHFGLQNEQLETTTNWLRSRSDVSYRKWNIAPGYILDIDRNEVQKGDSIAASLMNYTAHEFYVESTDSARNTYRLGYQLREDRLPVDGIMQDYLISKNIRGSYQYNSTNGSLIADINYRQVEDQLDLGVGEDEIISGRVNWMQSFLKRNVRSNFSYSTGNSRELRREFVYLPVPTGEGTHTWRDANNDGIQDLNEFFEAINPDERNFVKIFTPTDEYITSFQTFYIHTIDAGFPFNWQNQGGLRSFVSKLSVNLNFNVNYKTTSENFQDRLNPFAIDLADIELLSSQDSKRYTFFYNRNGRGFAGDFTFQSSDNKQLLTQGFETREQDEWTSNVKVDLSSEYTFRVTTTFGTQLNKSDFLDSRNFKINTNVYKPQLIWQPTNQLRLIGSYERKSRNNVFLESSTESSLVNTYNAEFTWNKVAVGSLRGSFSIVNIDFEGEETSYLGYILLDALQPGTNQTWQVNWQQKISKGMQISLLYNGRKSEEIEAIHTGSVQVTAFF